MPWWDNQYFTIQYSVFLVNLKSKLAIESNGSNRSLITQPTRQFPLKSVSVNQYSLVVCEPSKKFINLILTRTFEVLIGVDGKCG